MRLPAALLLVVMLAPSAGAATTWSQQGGDPQHDGVAPSPRGPLDVVSTFVMNTSGSLFTSGVEGYPLVATRGGLLGLATTTTTQFVTPTANCVWIRVADVLRASPQASAPFACGTIARIVGDDEDAGLVFVCIDGPIGTAAFEAFDLATLAPRWSARPPLTSAHVDVSGGAWTCRRPALDLAARRAVVAWEPGTQTTTSNGEGNLVTQIDLASGAVLWSTSIPETLFDGIVNAFAGSVPGSPGAVFKPEAVTQTATGYVIPGNLEATAAVAWLDLNGTPVAGDFAATSGTATPDSVTLYRSTAAASGASAAMVLGREIYATNPASKQGTRYQHQLQYYSGISASPAWVGDWFLAPYARGIVAYDAGGFIERWRWGGIPGALLLDLVATREGDVFAVTGTPGAQTELLEFVRLDLATGRELQRVPLPPTTGLNFEPTYLVPLPDASGFAVVSDFGRVSILQQRDAASAPTLAASDDYPPLDSPVTLNVRSPGPASSVTVAWGDGSVSTSAAQTHRYAEARPAMVSVTVAYADGTTGTTERLLHVGEPRPVQLTAVQRAFAPENQNLTFFLVGLAVTGGGAILTVLLRRARRARLERELRRLEALCHKHAADPAGGVIALEKERARWRAQLARGTIEDAQFAVLDGRAARAVRAWRYRMIGPATNRMSVHFRQLLDAALDDARVTKEESELLLSALVTEADLPADERERLRALLVEWTTQNPGLVQAT